MTLPAAVRVHLAAEAVDFRKGFNGLAAIVQHVLHADPLSGHLFVFHNRTRTSLKVLYWHNGGLCLLYKRLERGRFPIPVVTGDRSSVVLSDAELAAILDGIDLSKARRLARWNPGTDKALQS